MKFKMKLLALAALGLAVTAPAHAWITDSRTGNGELFMTVLDAEGQKSYTLDLNLTMNDFLSGIAVAGKTFNYLADANMTTFLAGVAPADFSSLSWAMGAMDGVTGNATSVSRFITTSTDIDVNTTIKNTFLKDFNSVDVFIGDTNGSIGANNSLIVTDPSVSAYAGSASWGSKWAGLANFTSTAAIGDTAGMYLLSQSTGAGTTAARNALSIYGAINQSANPVFASLDNSGNLMISAVPEADTWAMMLAGLGMVGFMARRRLAA